MEEKEFTKGDILIIILIIATIITALLFCSNQRQEYLNSYSNCIIKEMKNEHYTGTLQEAWTDLSDKCK